MVEQSQFVLGNAIWNTMLIGVVAWFIRNWMKETRDTINDHCASNKQEHEKMESKIEDHSVRIVAIETRIAGKLLIVGLVFSFILMSLILP